jgi:hypothetical protein
MERADRVGALLEDPATTFLIVTSPRHDPSEEAIHFHRKLADAAMPFGGLVVNRVHTAPSVDGEPVPALAVELGDDLAERVRESAHELAALAAGDEAGVERLVAELGSPPAIVIPELDDDVHDVAGLVAVREHLFGAA